jgi:hypothetical protein
MLHPSEGHHRVRPPQQPAHHPQPVGADLITARMIAAAG